MAAALIMIVLPPEAPASSRQAKRTSADRTSASRAAGQATITAIRHSSEDGQTRVVIDLSARATYRVSERTAPARIVIDFTSVVPRVTGSGAGAPAPHEIGTAAVGRVRINRMRRGTQVVIDLTRRTRYQVHFMAATRNPARPPRVVVDIVEPKGASAPPKRIPDERRIAAAPPLAPATPRVGSEAERVALEAARIAAESGRTAETAPDAAAPGERSATLPVTILIDPGHGGDDIGAKGPRGTHEKDVTLRVARELARRLGSYPGINARLTRSGDATLSLSRRQELAREQGADILVSIHANASPNRKARGVEIFYLSIDAARKESDVARRARPSASDLESTLTDLGIEEAMMLSARLAGAVRGGIDADAPVKTRKVMQAGFQVLKLGPIPAILVEVGFLTNADEGRMLTDDGFAGKMAPAIAGAVRQFAREGLLARPSDARRQLARAGKS